MNEFLNFFNNKRKTFPMHLEILYKKTCDWSIYIYKKGGCGRLSKFGKIRKRCRHLYGSILRYGIGFCDGTSSTEKMAV